MKKSNDNPEKVIRKWQRETFKLVLFKKTFLLLSKILYYNCKNKSENKQSLKNLVSIWQRESSASRLHSHPVSLLPSFFRYKSCRQCMQIMRNTLGSAEVLREMSIPLGWVWHWRRQQQAQQCEALTSGRQEQGRSPGGLRAWQLGKLPMTSEKIVRGLDLCWSCRPATFQTKNMWRIFKSLTVKVRSL